MKNYFTAAAKAISRLVRLTGFEGLVLLGYKSRIPQRQLLMGYLAYTIMGTALLLTPMARNESVPFVDNLFTAVSALSTTGLATVDVSSSYTFFGQLVILLLIQMGGVGYMTISSYIILGLNMRLPMSGNRMMESAFPLPSGFNAADIVRSVVRFALLFEVLGVALLYPYFLANDIPQPLWSAVFHSVSAFCTAGLSIYSDNMMGFGGDIYVNLVIMMLSCMGALGFIVMADIYTKITRHTRHLSLTTRVILGATSIITLFASCHLYFFEPSICCLETKQRVLASLFQAVSAMTTAGFNTVDTCRFAPLAVMVLIVTMYIGASPSGTGGGLKSTTIATVFAFTRSRLGMQRDVKLMNRILPDHRIDTSLTAFAGYTFLLIAGIYLTALFEPSGTDISHIAFEATSAIATTGLSVGVVGQLSPASKIVFVVLMFAGRLGMVTLGNALLVHKSRQHTATIGDIAV